MDSKALKELENYLKGKNLYSNNCIFICDDANNVLETFLRDLNNKKTALILLDPFGMQVKWTSIEKMRGKRVDLWILIPSGVIINRFLDKKGELKYIDNLKYFYGASEKEIKEYFYKNVKERHLFGEEERLLKVSDSIERIAQLYIEKLRTIFNFVIDEPLKLINSKNVTIFHFVFASNNPTACKIANQIIERKQK